MIKLWDFILVLLAQFSGGPGPKENNLVRFGLPAIMWAALLFIAWSRQRKRPVPRERALIWGFGLGLVREAYMFAHIADQVIHQVRGEALEPCLAQPLEHALAMASIIVVIGAFLRYILDDARLARGFFIAGLAATLSAFSFNLVWWPRYTVMHPEVKFHLTLGGLSFHTLTSLLIIVAIALMFRRRGWLRTVVSVALVCYLLGESINLVNYLTDKSYSATLCPIANTFHLLAIPILGVVYFQEQSLAKEEADRQLAAYRDHLEDLVGERTEELTATNAQLQQEIEERRLAEEAVAALSRRNELLLNAAGEGIFGVNLEGRHTFVNPAAARMLGYEADELIGLQSHAAWHHSRADGTPYPEEECPLHAGYKTGEVVRGSDQTFWRSDGTAFPVEYMSTPIYERDTLQGAVVVFRDITERKEAEAQIARRNAELAAQNAIAATISQSLDLDTILEASLDTVLGILDMKVGCISLLDAGGATLTIRVCRGGPAMEAFMAEHQAISLESSVSGMAVLHGRAVAFEVDALDPVAVPSFAQPEGIRTLVSAPLTSKGHALGAMTLGSAQSAILPQEGTELLTAIGQQIGVAIENARLYQQAEVAAALEERQRIAAEMHDGLAQTISYLGHQVDETVAYVEEGRTGDALSECERIRKALDQASTDVRHSIASLREAPQPRRSLQDALAALVPTLASAEGPSLTFDHDSGRPIYLRTGDLDQVLRVVQEAVLNAQRHAQARAVAVRLELAGSSAMLTISDDGVGFDPSAPLADGRDHFGLSIMRARATRLGGRIDIDSAPGMGARVALHWPLR